MEPKKLHRSRCPIAPEAMPQYLREEDRWNYPFQEIFCTILEITTML
jgi:hypothetical protein